MTQAIITILVVILVLSLIVEFAEYIFAVILILLAGAGIIGLVAWISSTVAEKKKAHERAVSAKVEELLSAYTPPSLFPNERGLDRADHETLKSDVRAKIPEKVAALEELDKKISEALSCPDASTPDEKLKQLKSKQTELDALKAERDALHEEVLNECAHVELVLGKVGLVVSAYTPKAPECDVAPDGEAFEDKGVCPEVAEFVHGYKAGLRESLSLFHGAEKELADILSCRGRGSAEEQLEHLGKHGERIGELKKECATRRRELDGKKIKLVCQSGDKIGKIKKAARTLTQSKKCRADGVEAKSFATSKAPRDLAMFTYSFAPAIFFTGEFFFCLFDNIILVFDKDGAFSSALKPSAFKVSVERKQTKYRFDENVDTDSRPVKFTEMKMTWVYTKKDGSPDLRYKNNPSFEFPVTVDGFEYGTVTVKLGAFSATFHVSSSAALDAFEDIKNIYYGTRTESKSAVASTLELVETEWEEEPLPPPIAPFIETKNKRI